MKQIFLFFLIITLLCISCGDDDFLENDDPPIFQEDNPLTTEGIDLGRFLFYDTKLSRTGTQSCSSCHIQNNAFADTLQFSVGVNNIEGTRQAPPIFNMARHNNGFFWDGRTDLLRHLTLLPIQDETELDETLENVITKLSNDQLYKNKFELAFGSEVITEERISLALEQFLLSIKSDDSKFDRNRAGEIVLSLTETRGQNLFFGKAACGRCHGGFNFMSGAGTFVNNGLDSDDEMTDFGRELVTDLESDRAKFKVPSLRNIALTAPYMHDGRFNTLEEVIDFYDDGLKASSTIEGAMLQIDFDLTEEEKMDLINFLKTLTDQTLINDPNLSNPF